MKLSIPTVHLNGTSSGELVDLRCRTIDALNEAGDALAKMSPNGRDYYLEAGGLTAANEQYDRRIGVLKTMIAELYSEVKAIQDQE